MSEYKTILNRCLNGEWFGVPTRERTLGVSPHFFSLDISERFPLTTERKINHFAAFDEMIWFLKGDMVLSKLNSKIWDKDYINYQRKMYDLNNISNSEILDEVKTGKAKGSLGAIYGYQWRDWGNFICTHDQVWELLKEAKSNPHNRRLIVSAWNVGDLWNMALPPCHVMWQVTIGEKGLNMIVTQRSCDIILGLPFNIAGYALLSHIIADVLEIKVNSLSFTLGNAHIYESHVEGAKQLLEVEDMEFPLLVKNQHYYDTIADIRTGVTKNNWEDFNASIEQLDAKDFTIVDYISGPSKKFEMIAENPTK